MEVQAILENIKSIEHGFKHIIEAAESILGRPDLEHFDLAMTFLSDSSYQVRMLATQILGELSSTDSRALTVLCDQVALDENWRVQEMLAKAFDKYCQKIGYQQSIQVIKEWLGSENPNVSRAVIEGLRIWTGRPYFKENATIAIKLISQRKADSSEYLRKSVGNALRDIGKKYPALIGEETANWDLDNHYIAFTFKLVYKS